MKTLATDARADTRAEPLPASAPSQGSPGSQATLMKGGGTATAKAGPALQDESGPSDQT